MRATAGHLVKSPTAPFDSTVKCILDWLGQKTPQTVPDKAYKLEGFILEDHGQRVECVSIPDHGLWSCRFSHPDSGLGDIAAIPGRHWTTDIAVKKVEDTVEIGLQVTCASLPDCTETVVYIRPGLVRDLARTVGLNDDHTIDGQPWTIQSDTDLETLQKLLASPDRTLPVILISQPDARRWEYTPQAPPYMLDANWLAKETIGYAHVVRLPWLQGFEWTKKVGREWSAFDGATRVYMPGLDFDDDSFGTHPLYNKERIRWFKHKDHNGEKAFGSFLCSSTRTYNVQCKPNWEQLVFITDARLIQAEKNTQELIHSEKCLECKSRFETQIDAFRNAIDEARSEAEQWSDESVRAVREREEHERENVALRRQVEALRANLEAKTGKPPDEEIAIPETYDDLQEWVAENLAGRLVLHPRAVRGLKDALYEDVPLVYHGLLLLANEYRDMRTGRTDRAPFDAKARELQLDLAGSIDKSRAGEQGDTYFLKYPQGSSKKEFMDFHLRKGTAKNDRYCLAIYFFWHDDSRQVVVGWLPSHLQNRMT